MMDAEQRLAASVRSDRQHFQIGLGATVTAEVAGQSLHGRRLEQAADRDLDVENGMDAADQPRRQQRMAAERKEVVVDADPLDPQHLGEQAAQDLLLRRARLTPLSPHLRRRQRRAVSLPFGVSGRRSSITIVDGTM